MLAVQFREYGGPEVLEVRDVPEPEAGPGQVRIAVRAASVNPIDWKVRAGYMAGGKPLEGFSGLGTDAAGVVDQVGDGVSDVSVGEEVFGLGSQTQAELAVLSTYVRKPASVDFATAAAVGLAGETALRGLNLLGVGPGSTVVIDGASGGVGAVAVQVAVARGATVIGTASERNQDYLASLGATPVLYGEGMGERVRAAAPGGVDAVFDVVGKTPIEELVALAPEPSQVVSIANFGAGEAGARVTGGSEGDATAALSEVADLLAAGKLAVEVESLPLTDAGLAQQRSQAGHVRGKLVLLP